MQRTSKLPAKLKDYCCGSTKLRHKNRTLSTVVSDVSDADITAAVRPVVDDVNDVETGAAVRAVVDDVNDDDETGGAVRAVVDDVNDVETGASVRAVVDDVNDDVETGAAFRAVVDDVNDVETGASVRAVVDDVNDAETGASVRAVVDDVNDAETGASVRAVVDDVNDVETGAYVRAVVDDANDDDETGAVVRAVVNDNDTGIVPLPAVSIILEAANKLLYESSQLPVRASLISQLEPQSIHQEPQLEELHASVADVILEVPEPEVTVAPAGDSLLSLLNDNQLLCEADLHFCHDQTGSETFQEIRTDENESQESDAVRELRCDEDISDNSGKKTRKRFRNTNSWKKNAAKIARSRGMSYFNSSGVEVAGKTASITEELCHSNCRWKCSDITSKARADIHEAFYCLDTEAKNAYLFGLIDALKPKCIRPDAGRPKGWSFLYYVNIEGNRRRVCKKAMCKLHNIGRSKLKHIGDQVAAGQHACSLDQRGRHQNRPHKLSDEAVSFVKEHILQFPAETSHYSRCKNGNRRYLSALLTVRKMYDEYVTFCHGNNTKPVSLNSYRMIFNNYFNLGFGSPRSDTCSVCDTLADYDEHKKKADVAFQAQKTDRQLAEAGHVHYITFDLQQTLPLPKLSTSKAFYLRQVWLYNLGVHLISANTSRGYCHMWAESEGGRGCNEIGSSLMAFLDVSGITGDHLIAWSDSCAGQNKNFVIVCLWQLLILTKKFRLIDHKFPEPGHTFLDSDRDFAHIEQELRKRENIYSMDQYQDIMHGCVRKSPFAVTRMADKFYDLQSLPQVLGLKNAKQNTAGEKVEFRDGIRWIRTEKFGQYQYKHSVNEEEPWKTVLLKPADSAEPVVSMATLVTPVTAKPVNSKKLADIQKLMCYIPPTYQQFYSSLIDAGGKEDEEQEDGADDDTSANVEAEALQTRNNLRSRKLTSSKQTKVTTQDRVAATARVTRQQKVNSMPGALQNKGVMRKALKRTCSAGTAGDITLKSKKMKRAAANVQKH